MNIIFENDVDIYSQNTILCSYMQQKIWKYQKNINDGCTYIQNSNEHLFKNINNPFKDQKYYYWISATGSESFYYLVTWFFAKTKNISNLSQIFL